MPLKINSTGGGSVTLDSGSTPNNVTITLPGVNGTMATLGSVTNNGVIYVNSSGQPTSGSDLVYTATGLGIGTSSPSYKLDVQGSGLGSNPMVLFKNTGATGEATLRLQTAANDKAVVEYYTNGNGNWRAGPGITTAGAFEINSVTAGATRMMIDSSGNLGLGVTPSAWGVLKGFDISSGGALFGYTAQAGITSNAYYNGSGWIYKNTGSTAAMYRANSGAHEFHTAPSGTAGNAISFTQAMTLDASGNLALGATTAIAKFYINAGSAGLMTVLNSDAANGGYIVGQTGGTSVWDLGTAKQAFNSGTSTDAGINVRNGFFGIGTNNTERMRIDASGNVGIGWVPSGSDGKLTVSVNGVGWYLGFGANYDNYYTAGSSGIQVFRNGNTERMRITSGGEVYIAGTTDQGAYNLQCNGTGVWGAGAYVNGSDARLKEEITDIESGLDVVAAMRPVTFRYKEDYSKDQSTQPGFIAQELQTAMAGQNYVDGVVQSGPEYLNVAYQNLIPILTKAIQELKSELDAAKTEINALKAKVQ